MTEINVTTVEEWRPVVGFEGVYSVSNLGRIRRDKAANSTYVGRLLRLYKNRNGYLSVRLTQEGEAKNYTVHSLVASAFIGVRPSGYCVNHKDGVKANNVLTNLEYVTPAENMAHAGAVLGVMGHYWKVEERKARYINGTTEEHHHAVLTNEDVAQIKQEIREFKGRRGMQSELARRYGVTRATICDLVQGRTWRHIK